MTKNETRLDEMYEDYRKEVIDAEFLIKEGVIDPEDRELFWYAESAEEIWDQICQCNS